MFPTARDLTAAPLALALLSLSHPVLAQTPEQPLLVLTATRFAESSLNIPAQIEVITRQDIRDSGAQSLPEVLKQKASIQVVSLYGGLATETAVDMRGFGEGGSQRTLVLLNGQRMNPIDMSSVDWSSIPLDSVQRIEILNGSGAVLFGDNAVGGVINIITGPARSGGSVSVGLGSHNGRQASASLSRNNGALSFALDANQQRTDGWRQNNAQERANVSGRVGLKADKAEFSVDVGYSKIAMGLPGSLTEQQYQEGARQAETPTSGLKRSNAFIRPGFKWFLSDTLQIAAELTYHDQDSESWISNFYSHDQRHTRTVSFTPRLQWQHGISSFDSTSTFGMDYYDGKLNSDKSSSPLAPITNQVSIDQKSSAFYWHNKTGLTQALDATVGFRRQLIDQTAKDRSGRSFTNNNAASIGDLGLNYRVSRDLRLFTRVGNTFRFANLDELTTWTGFVSKPVRPEKGRFVDMGLQVDGGGFAGKLSAYRLVMRDEIAWNNFSGENENLAKTLHQGLNFDGRYNINRQWQVSAGLNAQRARFLEGVDSGKAVPLVPKLKVTASVNYRPADAWNILLSANHVGSRPYGGDTANRSTRLSAYTTFDLAIAWKDQNLTARLRGQNLFDKRYAAVGYNYGYGATYYPSEGRSFFADLRFDF